MKKAAIILAVMLLSLVGTGFAEEDFSLRNGMHFGDTMDTIKGLETLELSSESDTTLFFGRGMIAGLDNSQVRYHFNEDGYLDDMRYDFPNKNSRDSIRTDYDSINSGLSRNYGTPLGNTGGSLYLITGSAIDSCATSVVLYQLMSGTGDIIDYDEWVIDKGNYSIKIDHIMWYIRDKNYDYTYHHSLSYHYFTNEDLSNAVQEKIDENAAIDSDL